MRKKLTRKLPIGTGATQTYGNRTRRVSNKSRPTMFDRFMAFWDKLTAEGRGITTSEFWLSLGTVVSTTVGVLIAVVPPYIAGIMTALVVLGYCISRGLAKINKPQLP